MDACYVSTLLKLGEIYKAQRPVQHDKAIGAYEEALAALRLGVETGVPAADPALDRRPSDITGGHRGFLGLLCLRDLSSDPKPTVFRYDQ